MKESKMLLTVYLKDGRKLSGTYNVFLAIERLMRIHESDQVQSYSLVEAA